MSDRLDPKAIGEILLFAPLTAEEHARLSEMGTVEHFETGDVVFEEGARSEGVYVMLEGRVNLSIGVPGQPDKSVLSLRSGELLGWSALLGWARAATAVAVTETRLLRLSGSDLLELCETDHRVGYTIMRRAVEEMADRLKSTRLQMLDVFGKARSAVS